MEYVEVFNRLESTSSYKATSPTRRLGRDRGGGETPNVLSPDIVAVAERGTILIQPIYKSIVFRKGTRYLPTYLTMYNIYV